MKLSKTSLFIIFLITFTQQLLFSQDYFHDDYMKGKEAYLNNQYDRALTHFENALSDISPEAKPVIYYWIGQSHMALGNYSKADNIFNNIINTYPSSPESVNSLYQKGRIFFKNNDYEKTIADMHSFLEISGDNKLNGNAYFWIAESLFFLGHKKDALVLYNKVINDFPESYKFEAANYRSELIRLGEREDELMKLLKWSHEESLKEREAFIRKEKEYKQAVLAYQRKLSVLSDNEINSEVLTLRETNIVLKKQISLLQDKISDMKKEIDILKEMNNDNKKILGNTAGNENEDTGEPVNEKQ